MTDAEMRDTLRRIGEAMAAVAALNAPRAEAFEAVYRDHNGYRDMGGCVEFLSCDCAVCFEAVYTLGVRPVER